MDGLSQLATIDITTGLATVVGNLAIPDGDTTCLMSFNDNIDMPDPAPVTGVDVTPETVSIVEGQTFKLTAEVFPTDEYVADRSCT